MALFVTLFAATESQLDAIFPGWPEPPDAPSMVPVEDPFTGAETLIKRWIPSDSQPCEDFDLPRFVTSFAPVPPILPTESDYERHMEERAPPVLLTLPHATLKNLSARHLEAIASILLGAPVQAPPARVTPEGFAVDRLPNAAVCALASVASAELQPLANRWASDSDLGFEGPNDALWVLRRLHALSRLCCDGESRCLCLWTES